MHPKHWKSGRKAVYCKPMDGDATGGAAPLDADSAGDALAALFDGDQTEATQEENAPQAAEEQAPNEGDANQEAAAEGEEGDSYDESETVTVMIDGKPVALTKAEIAESQKGAMRLQDYTRKTMEASEQRKAAEAAQAQAKAERDQMSQSLQQILAVNQYHDQQMQQWTPEQIEGDPIGYLQHQRAAQARAQQSQQAQAQLQQIQQQEQAEREQSDRDYFARQKEALIEANPEWADPAKFKAGLEALEPFLMERGFTRGEGRHVFDARFIGLLQDAKKYQDLQARAKETAQKVAKVPPKVAPPGRQPIAPTDGRTVAMKKLSTSGSVNDAATLMSMLL